MDNGYACSGIHDCAAQLPSGHQWHRPHLAGRRLCADDADELDGDLRRLRDTNAHADGHSDSHSDSHSHCNSNSNSDRYSYSYSYGNGYGNRYSYRYAHTYGHVRRYNNNKTTRLGALLVSA